MCRLQERIKSKNENKPKFCLKMKGIFEMNFDILNIKKNYILVINNKNFAIDFTSMKGEILEFNNFIYELQNANKQETITIFLCTENQLKIIK